MKKRFLSKSLIAKIALVLVIILVFEFAMAEPVRAAEIVEFGGTLLRPIMKLVVYLADGAISILQSSLLSIEKSFLYIDLSDEGGLISTIKQVITCVIAVVLIGAVAVGLVLGALPAAAVTVITSTTAGIVACVAVRNRYWSVYCKMSIPNSSCNGTGNVWKYFRICEYRSITRVNIKKPNWIF